MRIKFKNRNRTDYLRVNTITLRNISYDNLIRHFRQQGKIDTGHHIILYNDGRQEFDRDINAVAPLDFMDNDKSIYVLAEARDCKHLSDAQKVVLRKLQTEFNVPIKFNNEV